MTLTEGKNREVRRVLEHLGLQVSRPDPDCLWSVYRRRHGAWADFRSWARRPVPIPQQSEVRVIAGKWRGRPLTAPKGSETRPTADRVRETLFSMLTSRWGPSKAFRSPICTQAAARSHRSIVARRIAVPFHRSRSRRRQCDPRESRETWRRSDGRSTRECRRSTNAGPAIRRHLRGPALRRRPGHQGRRRDREGKLARTPVAGWRRDSSQGPSGAWPVRD